MQKETESEYVRRTQKDYSMSFKLSVVQEIETGSLSLTGAKHKYGIQGDGTVLKWLRKYGTFDWENQTPSNMAKSPEQKIMELEAKVRLLEKQKAFLEHQADRSERKAVLFDMMIELAEKEFNIPIRKKCLPEQSNTADKKEKKR
jgi:transposase-like protein